ncbi:MAG: acyl-CoA mutase large subunit family protein [Cycloclasticus sp.]
MSASLNEQGFRLPEAEELSLEVAENKWKGDYAKQIGGNNAEIKNMSGITVDPLYTPDNIKDTEVYLKQSGYPGQFPYTRGIYSTMHRGRTWTQRQLVGLGTPADYNKRVRTMLELGANAISLLPCNSGFRGVDCDVVPLPLLGTCGTVVNNVDHMDTCLDQVPIDQISAAMNDPSPFTLFAFMLNVAKRRGISWDKITGTSNQSDYISHYVANHMFYRLSLPGSRRVLVDHIEFCRERVPNWNPMSVVGQHIQQTGATLAETVGFTLSSAIQHAEDCLARGMDPDEILPRFTFFFDVSINFFEEVAKFRAARRIWAHITRDRLGAKDPKSWRLKFHAQTSGVDLTAQQPLNNIARTAVQAMAGIFGGLQSMHTDAYDEPFTTPTAKTAKIAVATQNILREEAHLCDVIDPLGGAYYIERLTDQMEQEALAVMAKIDAAGGMYKAVEVGLVQTMCGQSSMANQELIESGKKRIVGVNCYQDEEEEKIEVETTRPDPVLMQKHIDEFKAFKKNRSQQAVAKALDNLTRAANSDDENVFARVVEATGAGVTHGEIISCLRTELGFGHPLIIA